jgi:hypothetical protein
MAVRTHTTYDPNARLHSYVTCPVGWIALTGGGGATSWLHKNLGFELWGLFQNAPSPDKVFDAWAVTGEIMYIDAAPYPDPVLPWQEEVDVICWKPPADVTVQSTRAQGLRRLRNVSPVSVVQ